MKKTRLEAFSDGVMAIIITIMVLELKAPHEHDLPALLQVLPTLGGYVLSFAYVGIYWNNHHHLLQAVGRVNGLVLWANLHLLFWLSLIPFVTEWMGGDYNGAMSVAAYGFVLLMSGIAFDMLSRALQHANGGKNTLADLSAVSPKSWISVAAYALAIVMAFYWPPVSLALYVAGALLWIEPERRIEKSLME
jgi:uncharacterized membrane protein